MASLPASNSWLAAFVWAATPGRLRWRRDRVQPLQIPRSPGLTFAGVWPRVWGWNLVGPKPETLSQNANL